MFTQKQYTLRLIHIGLVVSIAFSMAGCEEQIVHPEPVRPVRAFKVGELKPITGRDFPGRASAVTEVELSFQVSGPLVALPVDVGSIVKKGDVIAAVDPRDFEAALASNQGNLERSRSIRDSELRPGPTSS